MQLRDFRKAKGLTLEQVSGFMGFKAASTVQRHEVGERTPSLREIDRYFIYTDGAVTAEDWSELRRKSMRQKDRVAA